ncbi:MAG: 1-acyl-sn-glycerol-3-phosphate acyltransferase [Propionibacteriaceae bacterium]|jgi:1-acyl-sn-glycerol-3-phosphate acyltransferase|nr:1-acyl-sn-glycerol-3-phosphate acyltransferase [Propionibacteriaceae bacterium]
MVEWGLSKARYKSPFSRGARFAAQVLLLKPVVWSQLSVEVHGEENTSTVADDEAFIVVANHSSHFDAPLIFGSLPRRLAGRMATGAAADYFFKHWYTAGPTALFFNAFPVDRSGSRNSRGMAGQLVADGVPVLIFPEGTRSRTGAMAAFNPGSASLAIKNGVPVLPLALVGAFAAWPAGRSRWLAGRPPVHVAIGKPMWANPGEIAHDFANRIRRAIVELHDATALAYGMPTQAEMALQVAALEAAKHHESAD